MLELTIAVFGLCFVYFMGSIDRTLREICKHIKDKEN